MGLDSALERARQIRQQPGRAAGSINSPEDRRSVPTGSRVDGSGAAFSPEAAVQHTARHSFSDSRASTVVLSAGALPRVPSAVRAPPKQRGGASGAVRTGDVWRLKSSSFVAEEIGSMLVDHGDEDPYDDDRNAPRVGSHYVDGTDR